MNEKIDTILFDLDGTLINTIDLIVASFEHTLDHYFPETYTRKDIAGFIGPPLSETFERMNPDYASEMIDKYREFNHAKHDELVSEYTGVLETLEQLYDQKYAMAVVTTKRRDTALKGIQLMNMEKYFPVVISLDEITKPKPDPEPLQMALEQLGKNPHQAIMVGDSEHDILAGKNTGTLSAGVSWSIKGKSHLQTFEPDVMLEEMPDLLRFINQTENLR
ncbi:pyrophosphatase PpaX [Alkalicoccus halolimnae]|uniref:Pyrophosphatase PpaX n=1 Tax=Alkalicoccus halolimnae TaxID=1667239 RepID=A0A5C7FH78_9BACI|nr:pyrophosphatase PpaX [Alkalicoccus halolimnae]TXF84330.1 pyrophosphatase PpaX [Alkalicoccus halolimnae]